VALNRRVAGLGLAVVLAVAGCGAETGTVSGKVTFNGRPLTFGMVAFVSADGRVASCSIEPDGSYKIDKILVGPAKISVQSLPPPPQMTPLGPDGQPLPQVREKAKEYVPIPDHYKEPQQSGLAYTVEPGAQMHDIELKP
jgi:hypothetical protein